MNDDHIFDDTNCLLGEGPLWHPERQEFFWFDILSHRLHRSGKHWNFDSFVSAAGWIDHDHLMVATSDALVNFNIETGASEEIIALDANNPAARPNDGRADPYGGFWIGIMGLGAEPELGSIWRYYRGELRQLYAPVTIANAICFSPDGLWAYFADTRDKKIMKVRLDDHGWPKGEPEIFVDLRGTEYNADGAVIAADGAMWNAQWGAYRVAVYEPNGSFREEHKFTAAQTSCPAFGGPDLSMLYVTSAAAGLSQDHIALHPNTGRTFCKQTNATGQREHQVILG
ncbi:MAG: SMP-30/gluconolactonase/LRE family protein [Rhodobacteraceae bacterium]|nr:SMP-30/gluconolactonase/LRE family protein [Paracoccaceae bacterium]